MASRIGCSSRTLNKWVKKAEVESGSRAGVPLDVLEKLKAQEREIRELRQANETAQYLFIRYTERLDLTGIEPSVGSVGDSYDNALAETVNGLCNLELIHRRGPWKSFEPVKYTTLEWVDWFNNRRLLEPIGSIPPTEAEQCDHDAVSAQKLAA